MISQSNGEPPIASHQLEFRRSARLK